MKIFDKLNEKLHSQGRYGIDAFSRVLLIMAAITFICSFIPDMWFLLIYAFLLLVWVIIRGMSRNTEKRRAELGAYEAMAERTQENKKLRQRKWRDRKTHKYYRCKYCDTVFRLPKGKGKIRVTCPGCREQFTKKT